MNERKALTGVDWLAIAVFAAGAFGTVLMMKVILSSQALESTGGVAAIAATWVAMLGAWPSLIFNAGLAYCGARLFLSGGSATIARNVIGLAGVALGGAVLLGAFSETSGGAIGLHTGHVVTERAHLVVGAFVGLVTLFAAVWFAWLRQVEGPIAASESAVRAPAPAPLSRPAPAARVAPIDPVAVRDEDFKEEEPREESDVRTLAQPAARAGIAPSPYPEDVRRLGQVPAGAKPLETPNARIAQGDVPASTVHRWIAPRVAEPVEPARAHLAGDADDEDRLEPVAARRAELPAATDDFDDDDDFEDLTVGLATAEDDELEAEIAAETVLSAPSAVRDAVEPLADLPAPSWEQPDLFDEPAAVEEPVDAYGTPLALIEELRRTRRDTGLEAPRVEDVLAIAPVAVDVPTPIAATDVVATGVVDDEADELDVEEEALDFDEPLLADDDDPEDLAEEEEFGELAEALSVADMSPDAMDDEDELDDEASEVDEATDEAQPVAAEVATATRDEELEVEPEPEPAPAPAPRTPARRARKSGVPREIAPLALDEIDPAAEVAARSKHTAPLSAPAAQVAQPEPVARPAARTKDIEAPSLFDSAENPEERQVDLQPHAAVPPERAIKSPAEIEERQKLLVEVGTLFIERGRVAVSMLQRQYSMDFDDACKVLDELQELGLIGPYLGGQRRDILLTRDQWLEKVSSA